MVLYDVSQARRFQKLKKEVWGKLKKRRKARGRGRRERENVGTN